MTPNPLCPVCTRTSCFGGRRIRKIKACSLQLGFHTGEKRMDLTVAVFRFSLLIVFIGNVSSSGHFSKYLFELNVLVLH